MKWRDVFNFGLGGFTGIMAFAIYQIYGVFYYYILVGLPAFVSFMILNYVCDLNENKKN